MIDYELEAAITNSDMFFGDKVAADTLIEAVASCIHELERLDRIKKALFYGRELPPAMKILNRLVTPDCQYLPEMFHSRKQGIDVIHAVLGIATEAGELLEAVLKVIADDLCFDKVNAIEESGDVFWYQALLANACNTDFKTIQETNIKKLRKRFPNAFSTIDANNRDLEEERKQLELFGRK